ncbi:MAG: helix-turn-helix domain-containing protein [Spirochaetaceae bacterium]
MKGKIFQRYIIFFSIVIIIPLIMGSVFYRQTILTARKHLEDNNQFQIEQIEKTFYQVTNEIERVGSHAIMETQLENLFEKEINQSEYKYDKWNFLNNNELTPYSLSNKIIGKYYIFLENSLMVYGPNHCSSLGTFWNYISKAQGMSQETWVSDYIGKKWKGDYLTKLKFIDNSQESSTSYIPYIKSFQFQGDIAGSIVFFLPESEILKQLKEISYSENGCVGIIGNNGNIISTTNKTFPKQILESQTEFENVSMLEKDSFYLTTHKLVNFPGKLIISQTKKDINSQALYISRITIFIIIFVTLIGTLVAIVASFFTSKPLFDILKGIKKQQLDIESGEKSSSDIGSFFRDITGQNRKLKNELKLQKPYIEQLFYKSLLSGELTEVEILNNSKLLDLDFEAGYFAIACVDICLNDSRDGIFTQIAIREFLQNYYTDTINYHQISPTRFALIGKLTGFDKNEAMKKAEDLFRSVKDKLENELHERLKFGIGLVRENLSDLYKSLTEAKIILKSIPGNLEDFAVFNVNSKGNKIHFFYTVEMENRLVSYVKLGKTEELNHFLKESQLKNMNPDLQSPEVQRLFLYNLIATLLKTYSETGLDNIRMEQRIKSLSSYHINDLKECFGAISELFQDLSGMVHSAENTQDSILKTKIHGFLRKNFRDNNLNLLMVAEEFQLSSFYFSRIFTRLFDESFRNYIEDMRLEYVKDKLSNTNEPLKMIAYDAGYSSLNTFSKVFKRKHNHSATEFRKMVLAAN